MTELSTKPGSGSYPDMGYIRDALSFARDERVLWRRNGGSVVFLPPEGDEVLTLRGGGFHAWELLHQPRTEPELVRSLAEMFAAPAEKVLHDLAPVLRRLVELGILRSAVNA
jgi:Coenzyme PQQ synthesis protein D (PqqD)